VRADRQLARDGHCGGHRNVGRIAYQARQPSIRDPQAKAFSERAAFARLYRRLGQVCIDVPEDPTITLELRDERYIHPKVSSHCGKRLAQEVAERPVLRPADHRLQHVTWVYHSFSGM
jgi:hypothetical protein